MPQVRPQVLQKIREQYPIGCTIELIEMDDPHCQMPKGLRGKVTFVDDDGTVFADWQKGSSPGALFAVDKIRRVD